MSARSFYLIRLIWPIFFVFLSIGCGEKDSGLGKEALIRVEDRVVTVLDFNEAFEISKMAFDSSVGEQSEDLQKAQLRLLNEMIIEMILLEKAQEIGITITDAELDAAVGAIKNDYPAGEFEETLLEFAVSYDTWTKRLKARLIIDKVIEKELENRITITPEDISDYFQRNYLGKTGESSPNPASGDINQIIVKQLRRQKAEEGYKAWIEELKAKYKIEINGEQWKKISGSPSTKDHQTTDSDSKNG
jgi:parvulin-like peptidyl-prolyl isomerase